MALEIPGGLFSTPEKGEEEFFVSEAEERLRPRFVVKAADETVTNSTTMQNDDELFISVSANQIYVFELYFSGADEPATTGRLDYTFTGPAGSTGKFWEVVEDDSIKTTFTSIPFDTEVNCGGVTATPQWFGSKGWIKTGNTAGNLQFQWAQENAEGSWSKVHAGSWLKVTRQ